MPSASCAPRCSSSAATAAERSAIAPHDGDAGAGARQLLRGGQADSRSAAGDQAGASVESQIHRAIVTARVRADEASRVRRDARAAPRPPRRNRLERGTPLAGASRRAAQRHGPRRGAGAGRADRARPAGGALLLRPRACARDGRGGCTAVGPRARVRRALARGARRGVDGPRPRGGAGAPPGGLRALARRAAPAGSRARRTPRWALAALAAAQEIAERHAEARGARRLRHPRRRHPRARACTSSACRRRRGACWPPAERRRSRSSTPTGPSGDCARSATRGTWPASRASSRSRRRPLPGSYSPASRRPCGRPVAIRRIAAARAMQRGDVLQGHEDVPVQLHVRDVLEQAVRSQDAVLILAAEQRELDVLALVLLAVVLHGAPSGCRPAPAYGRRHAAAGSGSRHPPLCMKLIPAATYSPRRLPTKYHRRREA